MTIYNQNFKIMNNNNLNFSVIIPTWNRKNSLIETLESLYNQSKYPDNFDTSYGDLTDLYSIEKNIEKFEPDEIYNLAAQSHVGVSFEIPDSTFSINALGPLNILEILKSFVRRRHSM